MFHEKDIAVAHYALEGLPNKVLAAEYRTTLPDERKLAAELKRTQIALTARRNWAPGRKEGRSLSGQLGIGPFQHGFEC